MAYTAPRTALIQMNVEWLRQALELLAKLDDHSYTCSPRGLQPHRAGGHLRHILEFYECFLNGLASAHIDYDARRRDDSIEQSRQVAAARIRRILAGLDALPQFPEGFLVWVRMEDAPSAGGFLASSLDRELQVLSSHTIHHFALIAVTLRSLGLDIDPEFGMAPSTLRYQARREAA